MRRKPLARLAAAAGLAALIGAVVRHGRLPPSRHQTDGGILVPNTAFYDRMSRLLLGSLFNGIANDIADNTPVDAPILEVGCGPGHLAIRLARRGLDVTAIDLDPAMIGQARINSRNTNGPLDSPPDFQVGDVAELPFPDQLFDVVTSTLSMHHWDDPTEGLTEIGRVLKPGGRVVIWDLRRGVLHPNPQDPEDHIHESRLQMARSTPWRWPWRLRLLHRTELHRPHVDHIEQAEPDNSSHG